MSSSLRGYGPRVYDIIASMNIIASSRDIIPVIISYAVPSIEYLAAISEDRHSSTAFIHLWSPGPTHHDDITIRDTASSSSSETSPSSIASSKSATAASYCTFRLPFRLRRGYTNFFHHVGIANDTLLIRFITPQIPERMTVGHGIIMSGNHTSVHLYQLPNVSHHIAVAMAATRDEPQRYDRIVVDDDDMEQTSVTLASVKDWIMLPCEQLDKYGVGGTSFVIESSSQSSSSFSGSLLPSSVSAESKMRACYDRDQWLCVSGRNGNTPRLDMIRFDTATQSWSPCQPYPLPVLDVGPQYPKMPYWQIHYHRHFPPTGRGNEGSGRVYMTDLADAEVNCNYIRVYEPLTDRWLFITRPAELATCALVSTSTYGIVAISRDMQRVYSVSNIIPMSASLMSPELRSLHHRGIEWLTCEVTPLPWSPSSSSSIKLPVVFQSVLPISMYDGTIIVCSLLQGSGIGCHDVIWMDTITSPGIWHHGPIKAPLASVVLPIRIH